MDTEGDKQGPEEQEETRAGDKAQGHGAREILKEASEKAREKLDEAEVMTREARQKAKEKIKDASEKARKTIEETGERTRETLDEASEKARRARQKAKEKLGRAGGRAKDSGRKIMNALADLVKRVVESHWFQSIHAKTWTGLALAVIFPIFMFFEQLNYRWWVMLPLGSAGLYLLGGQWLRSEDRKGIDANVCFVAFIVLALIVIYRDALLSEMMLDRMETVTGIKEVFE